jgi:hypothetical protein
MNCLDCAIDDRVGVAVAVSHDAVNHRERTLHSHPHHDWESTP